MSKLLIASCAVLLGLAAPAAALQCPAPSSAITNSILAAVNAERAREGRAPLAHDARLDAAAQGHACDMAANGFFDHRGSSGSSVGNRVRAAGMSSCTTAENIAYGWRETGRVMAEWMQSSGHRANILRGSVEALGVGYVPAQGGAGPWWVQVFANPC
ncbi:CAP domain-containing protein [Phaeovulum sp.]|uniref:CAP domain-containing protein n=1 Tax=Phaeovulum sp. TaxID=2934796 RepID=UPI00272F7CF2|nr:CAP domain-containing protein [Phaeovulum sp.]MDP1668569.1 CAP domain-containing protein [Phaeovulum sp.]MDZ4118853.1 CAP domain-containing protein [Phaeovulum sp.]